MARKIKYLSNTNLLIQLKLSHEQDRMTEELGKLLMLLVNNYAKKGCWAGYSYLDEMKGNALVLMVRYWKTFDIQRGNPFAYFTQLTKNAFIEYLNKEKKNQTLRDELLIEKGLDPSYSYENKPTTPRSANNRPE